MLRDLASLGLGHDPMKTEALWEKLFRSSWWGMGGGPVVYGGISAYDIACWDIRGKKLGVPVHTLLGGKTHDRLRSYASQIHYGWSDKHMAAVQAEEYAEAARVALADGYDCIKVDPLTIGRDGSIGHAARGANSKGPNQKYFGLLRHDDIEMGVERIRAIREAVGPKVDIICEIHSLLGTNSAIQFARAIEPYNIYFYEEPINPLNPKAMAKVSEKTTIPLATGERSYTRWGFRELLERQTLTVVQPDLCLVGGITEGKKICDMANLYDATVQIHVCGGPVAVAASLHMECVLPNFIIHEHHTNSLKHCIRELCVHDYQQVNGVYEIPDLPGLGQELNEEIMGQYLAHTIQ